MKKQNPNYSLSLCLMLFAVLAIGCQHCKIGSEISIPSSDATAPSVVMDFHLPGGTIESVSSGDPSRTITIPSPGTVTVIVATTDNEGVRDVQIWAGERKTSIDPNTGLGTTSGPGLLGSPTENNSESNSSVGDKCCTKRVTSAKLTLRKSATSSNAFEVSGRGINFGGATASTPTITLRVQ